MEDTKISSGGFFVPLFTRWMAAGLCSCISETVTFPLDILKTRLQLQNELGVTLSGEKAKTKLGMFQIMKNIVKNEGITALYTGLPASLLRCVLYGGVGVGLYSPVRRNLLNLYKETFSIQEEINPRNSPLVIKMLSGAITGSIGQFIALPTDIVKVRLQADKRLKTSR